MNNVEGESSNRCSTSGKCIDGVVRMFLKNHMTGAMGFPRDGRRKQEKKNIHRNRAVLWIDP